MLAETSAVIIQAGIATLFFYLRENLAGAVLFCLECKLRAVTGKFLLQVREKPLIVLVVWLGRA